MHINRQLSVFQALNRFTPLLLFRVSSARTLFGDRDTLMDNSNEKILLDVVCGANHLEPIGKRVRDVRRDVQDGADHAILPGPRAAQ